MAGPDALGVEIAGLADLDLADLRRRWRVVFGKRPPEHLSRSLLVRILSYRVQAVALGDLDRESVRLLDRLAKDPGDVPLAQRPMKRGTLLVREWEGALQRVIDGRLPRGIGLTALADLPPDWNQQRSALGLANGR